MNEETREHHIIVNVPKDIPSEFVHKIYEQVLEEAVQTFYKKNHDYNSSWRLESVDSITREILTRCYRILKLLELESQGQQGKVAEGVESELKDMINWSIFGVLLRRGYGLNIDKALENPNVNLNDFSEEAAINKVSNTKTSLSKESSKFTKIIDPEPIPVRSPGTVGADWDGVFSPELTKAEKIVMGDPAQGLTSNVTLELNKLYNSLMGRSNPHPAIIFLEVDNPINELGKFAIGPCVYVASQILRPNHDTILVDNQEVDKVIYVKVQENGAFNGNYETNTEAQVLTQLSFLPEIKPSAAVDLYSQNIAAQLFLGNQK